MRRRVLQGVGDKGQSGPRMKNIINNGVYGIIFSTLFSIMNNEQIMYKNGGWLDL